MEGGGEGKVGRKWVRIGWLEGACEGGGPQARRRGAPPKRAEPVCPPGRRAACGPYACGFCGAGEEMRGRGGAGKGEGRWGRRGGGAAPFGGAESRRRSLRRPPGGRSGCAVMRGLLLFGEGAGPAARMPAAFAGWGRSVPQMVRSGRKDCTCGRFFGIIGDGSTERRWRMCRL